jgi:hypothetical protein
MSEDKLVDERVPVFPGYVCILVLHEQVLKVFEPIELQLSELGELV